MENLDIGSISSTSDSATDEQQIKTLTSFDIFIRCIKRAENLVNYESSKEKGIEFSDEHLCDSYRAAIVLSISALDAFIRTLVISEIRTQLSNNKKPLNAKLATYIKNLLSQDILLEAARNYDLLERVEKTVREDFETKSFQGEWKISTYLELVGYNDVIQEVAIKANVNEKNLRRQLNVFTTRRHIIAHSGDYNLNQLPHKENDIKQEYAEECIKIVKLFAENITKIVKDGK